MSNGKTYSILQWICQVSELWKRNILCLMYLLFGKWGMGWMARRLVQHPRGPLNEHEGRLTRPAVHAVAAVRQALRSLTHCMTHCMGDWNNCWHPSAGKGTIAGKRRHV